MTSQEQPKRYSAYVSVRQMGGLRDLLREPAFEFSSTQSEHGALMRDGRSQFRTQLRDRLSKDKSLAHRIGDMRYTIRLVSVRQLSTAH